MFHSDPLGCGTSAHGRILRGIIPTVRGRGTVRREFRHSAAPVRTRHPASAPGLRRGARTLPPIAASPTQTVNDDCRGIPFVGAASPLASVSPQATPASADRGDRVARASYRPHPAAGDQRHRGGGRALSRFRPRRGRAADVAGVGLVTDPCLAGRCRRPAPRREQRSSDFNWPAAARRHTSGAARERPAVAARVVAPGARPHPAPQVDRLLVLGVAGRTAGMADRRTLRA